MGDLAYVEYAFGPCAFDDRPHFNFTWNYDSPKYQFNCRSTVTGALHYFPQ